MTTAASGYDVILVVVIVVASLFDPGRFAIG
jgi:hypothetical protein